MGIFGKIAKTLIRTAEIPVSAAKDVVTLGGILTDQNEPYTKKNISDVFDAIKEVDEEIDAL